MSSSKTRLLIVDDDIRLQELLREYLSQHDFEVLVASDGQSMNALLAQSTVSLIVLDFMMPGEDGISICKRLRESGDQTPIILLTALSEDHYRIHSFDSGADDFIAKPFNPRELLARIQAILRRAQSGATDNDEAQLLTRPFGRCQVDPLSRSLRVGDETISLTSIEFGLLKAFLLNPNTTMSRERLAILSKGRELDAFDRSIDMQISQIRKIIEVEPTKPRYIQTVWGMGYVFVPDA